jgi:hypothetical protein
MKTGTIKEKFEKACAYVGVEFEITRLLPDKIGGQFDGFRKISVRELKTKRQLNIALHELAHFVLSHSDNTVQNECEADLFADDIMERIYGYGKSYLFGRKPNGTYIGTLDIELLKKYAKQNELLVDIDESLMLHDF